MVAKQYTEITQYNSPNYTPNAQVAAAYGYTRTIDYITIHWWGSPVTNPSFDGVVSWLCQSRSQVSAHEVATGTGRKSATLVNYPDAAWHAGSAQGNAKSIGIECDPRCRDSDYAVVAEVIADLWTFYGKKPLRKHSSWSSTQCPGNYDLARLQREAEVFYKAKTNPTPAPDPVTLVKKSTFTNPKKFKVVSDTTLVNIPSNTKYTGSRTYVVGETISDIIEMLEYSDGKKFYRTMYARDTAKKMYGFGVSKLQEIVPVPTQPEWIRNLKDIIDTKLTVIPANGIKVYNLLTMEPVNNTIIPKGTQIDIAKETTVGGKKFYISNYAVSNGAANGILASEVGVPSTPPPAEKPEWLENLKDIEDKKMYTRSEAPVLDITNGTVSRVLPINSEVLITHATQIVGKDLLVLDGQKEVIETIYLNDEPIKDPDNDLEARVSALEALVKIIVDFLKSVFVNFK